MKIYTKKVILKQQYRIVHVTTISELYKRKMYAIVIFIFDMLYSSDIMVFSVFILILFYRIISLIELCYSCVKTKADIFLYIH